VSLAADDWSLIPYVQRVSDVHVETVAPLMPVVCDTSWPSRGESLSASSRGSTNARRGGVRRSLSEERIVDAALELTLECGLDGLTMAALAERLGVGAMTLYSYFRSRSELLGAMAQQAVVELYDEHVDVEGGDWIGELRAHYRSVRESLKRHPSLADLLFYRSEMLPGNGEIRDRLGEHIRRHVDSMVRGGVEPSVAVRAFYGLSMFTVASVLREGDLEPLEDRLGEPVETMLHIGASQHGFTADVRFGSDEQFEAMLDLMLRGLEVGTN
jgi:AcrR family transcriptional regulator